jgi:hypothetical protein
MRADNAFRLIEKDYLCRLEEEDPTKVNVYGYVA